MDMDVRVLGEVGRNAELVGLGAGIGQCGLRAFLHYVPKLARQREPALALDRGNLDVEDFAAGGRPR